MKRARTPLRPALCATLSARAKPRAATASSAPQRLRTPWPIPPAPPLPLTYARPREWRATRPAWCSTPTVGVCDAYDRSEEAANQACEDNGQEVEPSSSQDACEAAGASPSTVGGCVWDVKPPNCEVIIGDGTAANTCAPTDAFAPMIAGYIAQLNLMARVTACTPGDIGCSCDAAEAAAMEAQGNDNQDLSVVSDGCLSCVGMYLPLLVTVSSSSSH